MSIDLTDIDVPQNSSDTEVIKQAEQDNYNLAIAKLIQNQYMNYNDMGIDYISMYDMDEDGQLKIYKDLVPYVNENILRIADYDDIECSSNRMLSAGRYIYTFICVDMIKSIVPAIMERLDCTSSKDFDRLVSTVYTYKPEKFRDELLHILQSIIKEHIKLTEIDPSVKSDNSYNASLAKYYYYQDLILNGSIQLLISFIRSIIAKYDGILISKLL